MASRITRGSLEKGLKYYEYGITRFIGNVLVSHLHKNNFSTIEELREGLVSGDIAGRSEWLDMAGLIAPEAAVNDFLGRIESGEIRDLESVSRGFRELYDNYSSYELAWMTDRLETLTGKKHTDFTADDISRFLDRWLKAVEVLDYMRCEDARKEFSATAMVGFGIDGNQSDKINDFREVRGEADSNDFITQLKERLKLKQNTVAGLKEKLKSL